jgi:hypothetical protein
VSDPGCVHALNTVAGSTTANSAATGRNLLRFRERQRRVQQLSHQVVMLTMTAQAERRSHQQPRRI